MGRERQSKDGLSMPGHRQLSQRLDGLAHELGDLRDLVREHFGSATQAYVTASNLLSSLKRLESALVSSLLCAEAWLAGHLSNAANLLVGGSANQTMPLWSGTHLRMLVSNLNLMYARTSAGSATVTWVALSGGRDT